MVQPADFFPQTAHVECAAFLCNDAKLKMQCNLARQIQFTGYTVKQTRVTV